MSTDATFEDGREAPLNIAAIDKEDLKTLSALAQDAVFPSSEMRYISRDKRFVILLNRFRWEDADQAQNRKRAPERVQSLLVISNVEKVASQGVPRGDADMVMALLAMAFERTDAPSGHLTLTFAGDGALRLTVEALDVTLKDVTRPYIAPSRKIPSHPE
jgi:hypothetical protein